MMSSNSLSGEMKMLAQIEALWSGFGQCAVTVMYFWIAVILLGRSLAAHTRVVSERSCFGSYGFMRISLSSWRRISMRMVYLLCRYLIKSLSCGSLIVTVAYVVCMWKLLISSSISLSLLFLSTILAFLSSPWDALLLTDFWKHRHLDTRFTILVFLDFCLNIDALMVVFVGELCVWAWRRSGYVGL